jgi:hypothetical protein
VQFKRVPVDPDQADALRVPRALHRPARRLRFLANCYGRNSANTLDTRRARDRREPFAGAPEAPCRIEPISDDALWSSFRRGNALALSRTKKLTAVCAPTNPLFTVVNDVTSDENSRPSPPPNEAAATTRTAAGSAPRSTACCPCHLVPPSACAAGWEQIATGVTTKG